MTQYLITEPLRPIPCRCGAWTLAGHTGGLYARIEPTPLDEREELTALLDGRLTYDVYTETYRSAVYLEWRDADRIAGDRTRTVVTDHRCGRPIGRIPTVRPPPAEAARPAPTVPPY
ncbi:MAG: hypothetical protein ACRDP6_42115 [Actinoallomurus sp.]